jgi:SAM-dependent methyltransferase
MNLPNDRSPIMEKLNTAVYDNTFFTATGGGSLRSARAIVPLVTQLCEPKSVVDFGCGQGAWLSVFRENGVVNVLGFDGDYVDRSRLLIENEEFRGVDLGLPVSLTQRFDLAICLEVAEHLPVRSSRNIVGSLTSAAPVVLFSAAVPGQGGTHHVNEQWPEFWERLFAEHSYCKLDLIRPQVSQDRNVEWWYRQNLYLYATGTALAELQTYERDHCLAPEPGVEFVGAEILHRYKTLRGLVRATSSALVRAIMTRASGLGRRY